MTSTVENMIQELGALIVSTSEVEGENVLLYVEVQDGSVAAGLFFSGSSNINRFKVAPSEVYDCAWAFWKAWSDTPGYAAWSSMSYLVRNGKLTIDIKYPGQVDLKGSPFARREAVAREILGDKEIDESNPFF